MAKKTPNPARTIGKRSTHTQMLGVTRKMPKQLPLNTGNSPGGGGTMVIYPTFGGPV